MVCQQLWNVPNAAGAMNVIGLSNHHLPFFLAVLAEPISQFWRSTLITPRRSHFTSKWDSAMSPLAGGITMIPMMLGLCTDRCK